MEPHRRALLISATARVLFAIALPVPNFLKAQPPNAQSPDARNEDEDEPVLNLGDGITPPKVIHQVSPKPDSGQQGFRITGVVLIGLVVSSHGLPVHVHVVRSVDKDIDRSAVDAVTQWRFEPARKDGKPVAVRLTIEIRFHDV
jgi:TonB family protein